MAGIYIHIPFCRKACHYCNFHFSVSLKNKNDFIAALLKETDLRKDYLQGHEVQTIYFGGGTPSLLEAAELEQVCGKLYDGFSISAGAEITLEANPDDITPQKLQAWKASGINRLSLGVQSFDDADLRWMNRAHNARQAETAIQLAQQAGLHNLSVDLIYGTPGLTDAQWQQNLQKALALQVPHLSCYGLTVETGTALQKRISQHREQDVDPEKQARHFMLLMDWMEQAGYEHYEISNFALPGHRSKHNTAYWQGKPYLGLGPSAHSYNGNSRQWNIASNARYIQSLENNAIPSETEILTPTQQLNEYIMTALRTMEGLDLHYVEQHFGPATVPLLRKGCEKHLALGNIILAGSRLQLTRQGKLFADGIAAGLFF